jgi:signal transduction histidine kinase
VTAAALALDISVPARWEGIDPMREAVGLLVQALFGDDDLRDALAMVSEELLENAVKYGRPGENLGLTVHRDQQGLHIAVTNTVDQATQHVPKLCEQIDWIHGFPSAAEAYRAAIERVYRRTDRSETGLGIARVAYEGGCVLSCDLSVPGHITVRAVRETQPKASP